MQLQLQIACASAPPIPTRRQFQGWVTAALQKIARPAGEITVRVVARAEMAALNQRYRNRRDATDVLSFPFEAIAGLPLKILGDVVICAPLVAAHAATHRLPPLQHWAHLTIHGTLHLCGFDHQQPAPAEQMEALERAIMAEIGMAIRPLAA